MDNRPKIAGSGPKPPAPAVKTMNVAGTPTDDDGSEAERRREHGIDVALADSFPASDPPSWTLGHSAR